MSEAWDRRAARAPRSPVVVGVARAEGDRDDPLQGDDALGLMAAAARAAIADAAGDGSTEAALITAIGRISMPGGSWAHTDPGAEIGRRLGCGPIGRTLHQAGIPQQGLLDDAFDRIARGETEAVLVVGGEAAARTQAAKRAGVELDDPTFDGEPDDAQAPDVASIVTDAEIAAGLYDPPVVYALLDDAFRAATGQTPAERSNHIGRLWSTMSAVAASNPHAAFPTPRAAEWLRTPSDENRRIVGPYTKWLCSQLHVDQASAILVTSIGLARRLALDPDRLVVPLVGLHSSTSVPVAARRHLGAWPAMRVLGDAAAAHLGRPLAAIDHAEVYSCFPVAVSMAQDALGLPADPEQPPTITGGMAFAGGPWNNVVLQSTAAMVERVRTERGTTGLVTTVSGFLHKPGLAVYGTDPEALDPLVADLGAEAAAATPVAPTTTEHRGAATVVAATVRPERDGSRTVLVIAEAGDGTRVVATGTGRDGLADAIDDRGIVGEAVEVDGVALPG